MGIRSICFRAFLYFYYFGSFSGFSIIFMVFFFSKLSFFFVIELKGYSVCITCRIRAFWSLFKEAFLRRFRKLGDSAVVSFIFFST